MDKAVKMALRLHAITALGERGISFSPPIREPRITRRHIDGPYLSKLDGTMHWLTRWERLMTKIGCWDAWEIEARHSPIFRKVTP